MNQHLTSHQMEEWVIGQRTRQMEEHLRTCEVCANQVQRVAEPLELFGSAVRNWGDRLEMRQPWMPVASVAHRHGGWRWRLVLVPVTLLLIIAVPVYRREETKRQAAVRAVQDEILLEQVHAGISRSVPAPMEPLAKLMTNDVIR